MLPRARQMWISGSPLIILSSTFKPRKNMFSLLNPSKSCSPVAMSLTDWNYTQVYLIWETTISITISWSRIAVSRSVLLRTCGKQCSGCAVIWLAWTTLDRVCDECKFHLPTWGPIPKRRSDFPAKKSEPVRKDIFRCNSFNQYKNKTNL